MLSFSTKPSCRYSFLSVLGLHNSYLNVGIIRSSCVNLWRGRGSSRQDTRVTFSLESAHPFIPELAVSNVLPGKYKSFE